MRISPMWEVKRLFTKPDTGDIVAVDRYRPSEQQRRALIGRDMTCRFPGCTTPARRSDIDHTHDYALGGDTDIGNLAHLCEPHHVMKHHSGWLVRQLAGGDMEWTSPTGSVYVNEPISRVFFREDPDIAEDRERLRREQADRDRFERERRERNRDDAERRRAEYERAAEAARLKRYAEEAASYEAEAEELEFI